MSELDEKFVSQVREYYKDRYQGSLALRTFHEYRYLTFCGFAREFAEKFQLDAGFRLVQGSLNLLDYWNETGACFDLSRFDDEVLHTPDGVSMLQQMDILFGDGASALYQRINNAVWAVEIDWSLDHQGFFNNLSWRFGGLVVKIFHK